MGIASFDEQSDQVGRFPALVGKPLIEPTRWKYNGDMVAKAPVLDPDFTPARVIRYVGYRPCMKCKLPFWTEAVGRIRRCSDCGGAGLAPVFRTSNNRSDDDDF